MSFTMYRAFFDTNVLAYASDLDNKEKQIVAQDLVEKAGSSKQMVISTQVLQEFYVTAVKKIGISQLDAKSLIHTLLLGEVVTIDHFEVVRAVDGNILWQVSFWDALIIVAAMKANCSVIYSEDLNDGQIFENVQIVNPFRDVS